MPNTPYNGPLFTAFAHISPGGSGYEKRIQDAVAKGLPLSCNTEFATYDAMQEEVRRLYELFGATGNYLIGTSAVGREAVLEASKREGTPCPAWATPEERAAFDAGQ